MVYLYIAILVKYLVLVKQGGVGGEVGGLESIHCCGHIIISNLGALFCLKVLFTKSKKYFFLPKN